MRADRFHVASNGGSPPSASPTINARESKTKLAKVMAPIAWLRIVEGVAPDRWDIIGVGVCLTGAGIILFGPRPQA